MKPDYKKEWSRLNQEGQGTQALIVKLEHYLGALLSALDLTSIETPRPYSVITDNVGKCRFGVVLYIINTSVVNFS